RVPVKVTSENGIPKIGDLITPSLSRPGFGMRAGLISENIVGVVISNYDEKLSSVEVMINTNLVNSEGYYAQLESLEGHTEKATKQKETFDHKLRKIRNQLKEMRKELSP